MKARSTINDVAELAGVSVATVSRALRGFENVSPETRDRVQHAAERLQYAADSRASSLASGRTNLIGLISPDVGSWYIGETIAGVEARLAELGYDLLVYGVLPDRHTVHDLGDRLRARRVDGILMVDFFVAEEYRSIVLGQGIPVVATGEKVAGISCLTIDNRLGGQLAVQHLVELGHERIAFVGGATIGRSAPGTTDRDRLAGAHSEAERHGASVVEIDGRYTIESGRQAFHELARLSPRPTAVFCASDEMAFGMLVEADSRGWSVPDDLAIVGFDGHEMSELMGLTTVRQTTRANAISAVNLLVDRITDTGSAEHVMAPLELDVRRSTDGA